MQHFIIFFFIGFILIWGEEIPTEDVLLYSFETPDFASKVQAAGIVMKQDQEFVRHGKASLSLTAVERGSSLSFELKQTNWSHFKALSFWLYIADDITPVFTLEAQGFRRRGGFQTKTNKIKQGWQQVYLPLGYWTWKKTGDFRRIQTLKITFHHPCQIRIDEIKLILGTEGPNSWRLTFEEQIEMGYPDSEGVLGIKTFHTENICLVTKLDIEGSYLVEKGQRAVNQFFIQLPFLNPNRAKTLYLFVFKSQKEQQRYWDSISEKMKKKKSIIKTDAYTYQNYISTVYSENQDFMTRLLFQLIQRYLMANILGLYPRDHWAIGGILHYLIYNEYQPAVLSGEIIKYVTKPENYTRLDKLITTPKLEKTQMLQAFTFIHFMANGPMKQHFPALVAFLRHNNNLVIFFRKVLRQKIQNVENQYLTFSILYWSKVYATH